MALHNHLILNARIKRPPQSEEKIKKWLESLVTAIGMKKVAGPIASYVTSEGNVGMTAGVLIETSHIAMHVWDEETPPKMQFDLYTCSTLPLITIFEMIDNEFEIVSAEYLVMNRDSGYNIVLSEKLNYYR